MNGYHNEQILTVPDSLVESLSRPTSSQKAPWLHPSRPASTTPKLSRLTSNQPTDNMYTSNLTNSTGSAGSPYDSDSSLLPSRPVIPHYTPDSEPVPFQIRRRLSSTPQLTATTTVAVPEQELCQIQRGQSPASSASQRSAILEREGSDRSLRASNPLTSILRTTFDDLDNVGGPGGGVG